MDKWTAIKESIDGSPKNIAVLPANADSAAKALKAYQIPAESTLGIVLVNSGGITVEDRLRIYGAGEVDICERNETYRSGALVVAEDIFGGLFFFGDDGKIMYFAPDTLDPEETELSYSQFLFWAFTGDTDEFFSAFTYTGWKDDAKALSHNEGISFYPPLWTKEGKDPEKNSRKAIPMREIVGIELETRKQLENHG